MKRFEPLPVEGFCRDHQAYNALGMSRSKWWQGVKDGEYPQPVRHGRLTLWRVSDIRRLIDEIGGVDSQEGEAA
jgi:predicted DNA-binding transcriptional regulator AlpA